MFNLHDIFVSCSRPKLQVFRYMLEILGKDVPVQSCKSIDIIK